MIPAKDGRENIDDWFYVENLRQQPESRQTDHDKNRTKDFLANELHAMSTLSLYDDDAAKIKMPGDGDK